MTTGRILVVDDEINIRGALVTLLEKSATRCVGQEPVKKRWNNSRLGRPILF